MTEVNIYPISNTFDEKGDGWQPISTYVGKDNEHVELWLVVYPSPRSMGIGDSYGNHDAWCKDGKWYDKGGELFMPYIKEWRSLPK